MVKVKICGFTRADDVKAASDLGVDMVGVIVIPHSSRGLTLEQAQDVLKAGKNADKVAVIMPDNPAEASAVARMLNPDYLQIHSKFSAAQLTEIKKLSGKKIIGVVAIPQKILDRKEILDRAIEVSKAVDYILLDTKGSSGGGTGLTHDWGLSREIRDVVGKPVFLAGGLNPNNVKAAIEMVQPYGVDVATGVESALGKKDPKLMHVFIEAAKAM
ncbi:MAG: N-(5'-phosphoribosyl)anthranilate isomerase [Hadesarchaea archaeon CG08_land_8_20_14_0_20_51_8]|nr:MAG: N-(5'-phosphoribosyl)anthranilate isomerase [Hadesarchaea archaeon CG08_land_8_20_14_0_20_51_8]